MQKVSAAAGTAFAVGVGDSFGLDPETVRAIAADTVSQAMEGGIEGIASWGVEETAR
jgi:hypothetical protein